MLDLFYPPKPPAIKPTRVVMLADVCPLREAARRSGQVSEVDKAVVRQAKKSMRYALMTPEQRAEYLDQQRERYWRSRDRIVEALRAKRAAAYVGPKLTPEQKRERYNRLRRERRARLREAMARAQIYGEASE
jgi:hypothetical protein